MNLMSLGLGLSRATYVTYGSERQRLRQACQELESTFLYILLKEMEKGVGKDMFSSGLSQDIYRDLRDVEMSRVMAQRSPLKLADTVYRSFSRFL